MARLEAEAGDLGCEVQSLPLCLTGCHPHLPPASSAAVGSGPPPEAEQAWPQSSGEEELQLQLALAMSKEEADQVWGRGLGAGPGGLTSVLFCHCISMPLLPAYSLTGLLPLSLCAL